MANTRLQNEAETCAFAAKLAESLKPGDVVGLSGNLGAGKSVFARATMRALGVKDEIMPSPTFSLIQEYDGRDCKVAHMDWYRLENENEIAMLGVQDFFAPPWITIIEWPERGKDLLPEGAIGITLRNVENDPNVREVCFIS